MTIRTSGRQTPGLSHGRPGNPGWQVQWAFSPPFRRPSRAAILFLDLPLSQPCGMIWVEKGGESMRLPDFENFLNAINQDALQDTVAESVGNLTFQTGNLLEPENFNALVNWIIKQSVSASTNVSLIFLRTYHQWLQKQFEQTDGHSDE